MRKVYGLMGAACLAVLLCGWTNSSPAAAAEGGGNVYDVAIEPLTVKDCGRCHPSHFARIKEKGAKHSQVVCTECHEVFHAYNPLKNNYAAIMPKCASCHDAPHGQDPGVQKCLPCHADPHQPLDAIADPTLLEGQCRLCHAPIAQMLTAKPSKHTTQPCSSCHSKKHGRIPECSECHQSHSPTVQMATADCMACHPVHTPLAITYPLTQSKAVCGGCHDNAFALLAPNATNVTKHSALTCAKCHPKHGYLPTCQECHGKPHSSLIHDKYATCGGCHGIAHDVKK